MERPRDAPEISNVVMQDGNMLVFRFPDGQYSQPARTSCGHDWIHLMTPKSDGFGIEHHGIKVHCSACGRLQAFGPAAQSSL